MKIDREDEDGDDNEDFADASAGEEERRCGWVLAWSLPRSAREQENNV